MPCVYIYIYTYKQPISDPFVRSFDHGAYVASRVRDVEEKQACCRSLNSYQ